MTDKFKLLSINFAADPFIKICVFMKNKSHSINSEFEVIVTALVICTVPNVMERFLFNEIFEGCILKEKSELFVIFDKALSKEEKNA